MFDPLSTSTFYELCDRKPGFEKAGIHGNTQYFVGKRHNIQETKMCDCWIKSFHAISHD